MLYFYVKEITMHNTLLVGSSSASRKLLLEESKIPFTVIGHTAEEESVDHTLPLTELVQTIARLKMDHTIIPKTYTKEYAYVLTADSLGHDNNGKPLGKPTDRDDAIAKIMAINNQPSTNFVAVCIDKKKKDAHGHWKTVERKEICIKNSFIFHVPEHWMDRYLDNSWAMIAAGAIAIENYGAQFTKLVEGSFSGIMGLPMYEVRQALDTLGFFD